MQRTNGDAPCCPTRRLRAVVYYSSATYLLSNQPTVNDLHYVDNFALTIHNAKY